VAFPCWERAASSRRTNGLPRAIPVLRRCATSGRDAAPQHEIGRLLPDRKTTVKYDVQAFKDGARSRGAPRERAAALMGEVAVSLVQPLDGTEEVALLAGHSVVPVRAQFDFRGACLL
jgi:hypothetical protein